ncbi:hypothetical protein NVP1031O_177 [Vibrio phage 1.031.O._10N.261.46.F8]|nr:hypothetical protein NVP1031O_177 [Vibrio phage 1.031.O._10N.261.46.F8]
MNLLVALKVVVKISNDIPSYYAHSQNAGEELVVYDYSLSSKDIKGHLSNGKSVTVPLEYVELVSGNLPKSVTKRMK